MINMCNSCQSHVDATTQSERIAHVRQATCSSKMICEAPSKFFRIDRNITNAMREQIANSSIHSDMEVNVQEQLLQQHSKSVVSALRDQDYTKADRRVVQAG